MSKTIIAVAVLVIVIVGGYFLLSPQKTSVTTPTSEITPTSSAAMQESASPSSAMQENTVTLSADGFSPATLTVKAGTEVTWTNKSGAVGNVNSDVHPTHTIYPPLNLGKFADGESLSLTFDKAGTYGYHNHLDSSQTGTVIVQ